MKFRIFFTIFVCFLWLKTPLLAQYEKMSFERISIEHGLSQVVVRDIMYDSKGYIWIRTEDGLNRYDGYDFKIYRPDFENPDKTIADNNIQYVFEDSDANLWISTANGLSFFNRRTEVFTNWRKESENLDLNNIFVITSDRHKNIWFPAGVNLIRMKHNLTQANESKFESISELQDHLYPQSRNILNAITDKQGNVWLRSLTNRVFYIPANETNAVKPLFIPVEVNLTADKTLSSDSVFNIHRDNLGNIWCLSQNFITKLSIDMQGKVQHKSFPITGLMNRLNVNLFHVDMNGNLLVGTQLGLQVFQNNFTERYFYRNEPNNSKSLSQNLIMSIGEDEFGIIWIGTTGGLNKFDKRRAQFTHVAPQPNNPKGLQTEYVFSFAEDTNGELWVGTINGNGLYILNPKTKTFRNINAYPHHPDSLSNSFVRAILPDGDQIIWIATMGGGLCKYNKKTKKFTRYVSDPNNPNSIANNQVFRIAKNSENKLWLGTANGLCLFDPVTEKFTNFLTDNQAGTGFVRSVFIDSEGILWAGAQTIGLYKITKKSGKYEFKLYKAKATDPKALSTNNVLGMYEHTDGSLWFSTLGGGVCRFDKKTEEFSRFTTKNGLPSDVVYGILPDEFSNLWFSTNKGLSKFNILANTFQNYTAEDGLQSNEFNGGAYFKGSDGRLYFGGINGYNVFYPRDIAADSIVPKLVFTDLKVSNKSVIPGSDSPIKEAIISAKVIELGYIHRDFTIEFAALHYAAPQKNRYAYKMEGYDKDWIDIGNSRSRSFSSFPHGEYVFRVKAANSSGVWNEEGIAIKVIIHPPFYKTNAFYITVILLILSIITFYIKWRERTLKREKLILEKKVAARTEQISLQNKELQQQKEEIEVQAENLEQANHEITLQKNELQKRNIDITDSILYAKRIQSAIQPNNESISTLFSDYFILNLPRNIVSGDFYFIKTVDNYTVIAVADCTGHGVPGAFMSMLGVTLLNEIITAPDQINAAEVLDAMREKIKISLKQTGKSGEQQDGMDMALLIVNRQTLKASFAGANNPLYLVRNQAVENQAESTVLTVIKPDRMPLGIYPKEFPFTNNELQLQKGDSLYLFSDGYYSQFGGEKGEKMKTHRFMEVIQTHANLSFEQQQEQLQQYFDEWKGKRWEQVDDVLVFGFKI